MCIFMHACEATARCCMQAVPGLSYWADADVYNVTGGCGAVASLPDIVIKLDGADYTLSPQQYIAKVPACPMCYNLPHDFPLYCIIKAEDTNACHVCCLQLPESSPEFCISAVVGGGVPPYLVLGDSFMRAYYSTFSVNSAGQGGMVGLAASV